MRGCSPGWALRMPCPYERRYFPDSFLQMSDLISERSAQLRGGIGVALRREELRVQPGVGVDGVELLRMNSRNLEEE